MTDAKLLIPAAEYLRMSTEHQQYSPENNPRRYGDTPKATDSRWFGATQILQKRTFA